MHMEMAISYYRRHPRGDDALLLCGRAVNYARYMTWYLKNVQNMPMAANNDLMKCAHVCRHSDVGTAVPAGHLSM